MSGSEMLYEFDGSEASLETLVNTSLTEDSNGELKFVKLYYTDGFAYLITPSGVKFFIHECKVFKSEHPKIGTMHNMIRKATLQAINYYLDIKHGKIKTISSKLKDLAKKHNYDSVYDFISENFCAFILTSNKYCSVISYDDVKDIIDALDFIYLEDRCDYSPSQSYKDKNQMYIINNLDINNFHFDWIENWNTKDTYKLLKSLAHNGSNI